LKEEIEKINDDGGGNGKRLKIQILALLNKMIKENK
jgi:hypothetical protein